jgi:hypothetical protein
VLLHRKLAGFESFEVVHREISDSRRLLRTMKPFHCTSRCSAVGGIEQATCSCFTVDIRNDINPHNTEPDHYHPLLLDILNSMAENHNQARLHLSLVLYSCLNTPRSLSLSIYSTVYDCYSDNVKPQNEYDYFCGSIGSEGFNRQHKHHGPAKTPTTDAHALPRLCGCVR